MENPVQKFEKSVIKLCDNMVTTAITLHLKVASSFLPTAIKFHYNFNLRDIANIFTVSLKILKYFILTYINIDFK